MNCLLKDNTFVSQINLSTYLFQCVVGWAGNGKICGPDSDLDRWPDIDLPCNDTRCKKVGAVL